MKKTTIGWILLFSAAAFNAHADEPFYEQHMQIVNQQLDEMEKMVSAKNTAKNTAAFNDKPDTFNISYQNFYSHYSEPQKARTVTGIWNGAEGRYVYRPPQKAFLNTPILNFYSVEGLYATGENKLSENETGGFPDFAVSKVVLKDIPGYMFENRLLAGKDFLGPPSWRWTPYTGFGVRYETDHSAGHYNVFAESLGSPVVAIGYNFSDLYYYVPTGFNLELAGHNGDKVTFNMEYDYLVKGYERDDYANVDQFTLPLGAGANSGLRFALDHGWGSRMSLKFVKHLSSVDLFLEPYLRYWHINASKAASGMFGGTNSTITANKNATLEAGSSLGLAF